MYFAILLLKFYANSSKCVQPDLRSVIKLKIYHILYSYSLITIMCVYVTNDNVSRNKLNNMNHMGWRQLVLP